MAGIKNGDAKMILPLPGIFIKEDTNDHGVPYTQFTYECNVIGRMYKHENRYKLFIIKQNMAISQSMVDDLKSAVNILRKKLGLPIFTRK